MWCMTTAVRMSDVLVKYLLAICLSLATGVAAAQEAEQGNASNPLAAVNNVDLRWQYTSGDLADSHRFFIDGSYMVVPKLKLKYELHYVSTDLTGSDENDFEKLVIKPIYFLSKRNSTRPGGSKWRWGSI